MCGSDACLFHQRLIAPAVGRFCFFGQHTPAGAAEGCESDVSGRPNRSLRQLLQNFIPNPIFQAAK
jgi:hypothetical protein